MKRRAFLCGPGLVLATPLTAQAGKMLVLLLIAPHDAAGAQPAAKRSRIGWLDQGSPGNPYFEAFRQGLHDLGWIEGQNITVEARFAEGKTDRLPTLAAELVGLKVDVIATVTTPAALAAKQATTKIPIVFGGAADPLGSKIVRSLARPAPL